MKLLTERNFKTDKSAAYGYLTAVLLLEPNYIDKRSGVRTCPDAGLCVQFCLSKCGRNKYEESRAARLRRTELFFSNIDRFINQLVEDISTLELRAKRHRLKPAVRLNGLSDIPWESSHPKIFDWFPDVQFYDYTKSFERALAFGLGSLPPNYHLTYSLNERSPVGALNQLACAGVNCAVIQAPSDEVGFKSSPLPGINGDAHDLRFLDPKGVIVWLSLKQPYRMNTGFKIDASALVRLGK